MTRFGVQLQCTQSSGLVRQLLQQLVRTGHATLGMQEIALSGQQSSETEKTSLENNCKSEMSSKSRQVSKGSFVIKRRYLSLLQMHLEVLQVLRITANQGAARRIR
jgi:hypothetical protein